MYDLPPVLILVGGMGSRLKSVIDDIPKPLAIVSGKPFLQWHLDFLLSVGVSKVVLSAGYLAESFNDFLDAQSDNKLAIELLIESERMGTGGAITYALKQSKTLSEADSFFCLNGDSFVSWDPTSMWSAMKENQGALVGVKMLDPSRYGTLRMDSKNGLLNFEEKSSTPSSEYINAGVYGFNKSLFDQVPIQKQSLEYDLFPAWISKGHRFSVVLSEHKFIDIGTPESYKDAQRFF